MRPPFGVASPTPDAASEMAPSNAPTAARQAGPSAVKGTDDV